MVFEKTAYILSRQFETDMDAITPDTSIAGDLGADRLDFVELFMALEEEFEIELDDGDIDSINTVSDLLELVLRKI